MRIIKLPSIFRLQQPHEGPTIQALCELIKTHGEILFIDFSDLREIKKEELLVLSAQLEKSILSQKNSIFRKGRLPNERKIRKLLTEPLEKIFHVNKALTVPTISDLEKEKLVNPTVIDSIVKELKRIGIKEYYIPFNVFLTELVGNAVEHGIENRNINWWLTHELDSKTRVMRFTFVDMGLGIIKSHMKAGVPLKYYFLRKRHIVLNALFGILGSSTKQINRGRGLPQLRDMIEKGYVSNLELITNTVTVKFINGQFVVTKHANFVGTYYTWTIDQNNFLKWKNIK